MTIELKSGDIYRGRLTSSEDTMNCVLHDVVMTNKTGKVTRLENVWIRGGWFYSLSYLLTQLLTS